MHTRTHTQVRLKPIESCYHGFLKSTRTNEVVWTCAVLHARAQGAPRAGCVLIVAHPFEAHGKRRHDRARHRSIQLSQTVTMSSKASTKANSVSSSRSTSRSSSFYGSTSLLPALLRNHEDNADSEASTPRDAHSSLSRTLLRQGSKHSQYSQLQDPLHALETAQGILQSMPGLARKGAGGCGNGSGDVAAAPW
eukprot:scaffold126834_cov21-Tisochrysis_lutea.AAC.1